MTIDEALKEAMDLVVGECIDLGLGEANPMRCQTGTERAIEHVCEALKMLHAQQQATVLAQCLVLVRAIADEERDGTRQPVLAEALERATATLSEKDAGAVHSMCCVYRAAL